MKSIAPKWLATGLAGVIILATAGCEMPPPESVQRGYRGTGMVHVANPATVTKVAAANVAPEAAPAAPADGPKAKEIYKNVQVLGDLSVGEFTRLMVAMTNWVAPEQGCTYCHADGNFEADNVYTKTVARRMLQMTRTINADYKAHVGDTGVTCYTCHRGKPVPQQIWFSADTSTKSPIAGWRYGQNAPAHSVGRSSLPNDPFTPFFTQAGMIGVASDKALPVKGQSGASIQHTEWTYGLMMHFSDSLGVNCTYCHNSRAFSSWPESSTPRVNAWHGIRMVRALNNTYLDPLKPVYPAERLGPTGDAPKANCATCHQGANKPLLGAKMLKDHPELAAHPAPAAEPAPAPAAAPLKTAAKAPAKS